MKCFMEIFREFTEGRESKARRVVCLVLFCSLLCAQLAYAEGFKLVKVGEHYEPVLKRGPSIALPQTNIRAGLYLHEDLDGGESGKVGFLNGEELTYVESMRTPLKYQYGLVGGVIYAILPPYFIFCADQGGTFLNGLLFLFKFDKDGVKLLDCISEGYLNNWGSGIQFKPEHETSALNSPVIGMVGDLNHDGIPEIEVLVEPDIHYVNTSFSLYFDIIGDKLRINLESSFYIPLFKAEEQRIANVEKKSHSYYIYGFLSKNFDLKSIETALKDDTDRRWIVDILKSIDTWDAEFHDVEKFTLKKINLGKDDK